MRSRILIRAIAIFAVSFIIVGALNYGAQPLGAQVSPTVTDAPPQPARADPLRVYLPLVLVDAPGRTLPVLKPGTDQPSVTPTAEPTPQPAITPTRTPLAPALPPPETPLTGTISLADLPVVTHCGTIAANETWAGGYVHRLTCGVTVNNGVTLTVAAGAVVKFNAGLSLSVNGALVATGGAESPVYFTSIKDDTVGGDSNNDGTATAPAKGDWEKVYLSPSGRATLTQTVLRYGGAGGWGMLHLDHTAQATLDHATLAHSSGDGIRLNAYRPEYVTRLILTATTVENNTGHGLAAATTWSGVHDVTSTNSTFRNNGGDGLSISQPRAVTISNCSITGNAQFGVRNGTPGTPIDARNNWWGDPTGPQHPTLNPGGTGNRVSDGVQIDPWLVSPPTVRLPGELALGETVEDVIWLNRYNDYRIQTAGGVSLLVQVTPLAGSNALWVYGKAGDVPVYTRFDLRAQDLTPHGTYDMLISPAQPGEYVFSVYGRDVAATGGRYSIVARVLDRYLSDIAPRAAGNAGAITVRMSGLGLAEGGITARLTRSGVPARAATEVTSESATALLARFDLMGAAAGIYAVVLTWPGGHAETLPAAFEITPGVGPKLETRITAPESVRPGRQYMVHVDYSNTGDADMAAPLLRITADNAQLKLPEQADFQGSSIQLYGINDEAPANVLPPGTGSRISLVFMPSSSGGQVQFTVSELRESGVAANMAQQTALPPQPAEKELFGPSAQMAAPAPKPEDDVLVSNGVFSAIERFYSPHIQQVLEDNGSGLTTFSREVDGVPRTAAELIMDASIGYDYMVNPKLLLALLESISGLITDPAPSQEKLDLAMGNLDPAYRGFEKQVRWAAEQLGLVYESNLQTLLPERRYLAASFAFQSLSKEIMPLGIGQQMLAPDSPRSLAASYKHLFDVSPQVAPQAYGDVSDAVLAFMRKPFDGDEIVTALLDHEPTVSGNTLFTGEKGGPSYSGHDGTDYGLATGDVVRAGAVGRIANAARDSNQKCFNGNDNPRGASWYVAVDHYLQGTGDLDPDVRTIYWHLSDNHGDNGRVWASDNTVEAGVRLGLAGNLA